LRAGTGACNASQNPSETKPASSAAKIPCKRKMAVQEVVREEMGSSRIVFRGNAVGAGIKPDVVE
jgi:hypothetical protein